MHTLLLVQGTGRLARMIEAWVRLGLHSHRRWLRHYVAFQTTSHRRMGR